MITSNSCRNKQFWYNLSHWDIPRFLNWKWWWISIPWYDLLRAGHISNTKRGGICICFKKKKCFFTSFYRSPSQTSDEFEDFCTDLNLFLSNMSNDLDPACYIITGNFNVRFLQLWALDKENNKGREISFFTSFLNLKIYILHIRLCGRVSDKNFFTRPISGNKTIFLALLNVFHNLIPKKKIEFNFKDQRYCRVGPTVNDRNCKE